MFLLNLGGFARCSYYCEYCGSRINLGLLTRFVKHLRVHAKRASSSIAASCRDLPGDPCLGLSCFSPHSHQVSDLDGECAVFHGGGHHAIEIDAGRQGNLLQCDHLLSARRHAHHWMGIHAPARQIQDVQFDFGRPRQIKEQIRRRPERVGIVGMHNELPGYFGSRLGRHRPRPLPG